MLKTLTVVFSFLYRLPQSFLLKIFLAVSDSCMPAWPIWCYFLRISQYWLYSKIYFSISLKHYLHSPCNGHSAMITLLQTEFWWAEHIGLRMPTGSQATVWIMDTDIHPPCSARQSSDAANTASLLAQWLDSRTLVVDWMAVQVFWETLKPQLAENIYYPESLRGLCDVLIISLWCIKTHALSYKISILLWIHN